MNATCNEISRLRNRHVARLLDDLSTSVPPVIINAIKREFTYFANDITELVIKENTGYEIGNERDK